MKKFFALFLAMVMALSLIACSSKGMTVEEAIKRLGGIHCGPRPTSCPDQLATALKQYVEGK